MWFWIASVVFAASFGAVVGFITAALARAGKGN